MTPEELGLGQQSTMKSIVAEALRAHGGVGSLIHTQTVHRCMRFKTISLSDSVYRQLRAEKRPGESFSEAIARLLEAKQPPLMKYAGAWKPLRKAELAAIRTRIDRLRHGTPAR